MTDLDTAVECPSCGEMIAVYLSFYDPLGVDDFICMHCEVRVSVEARLNLNVEELD